MDGITVICSFVVLVALGSLAYSFYEDREKEKC